MTDPGVALGNIPSKNVGVENKSNLENCSLHLSLDQISALESIYVEWPKNGIKGVLHNILPVELRLAVLGSPNTPKDLRSLVTSWVDEKLEEQSPFRALETEFDPKYAGTIGYPIPSKFAVRHRPDGPVTLEMVKKAVKGIVVGSLLIVLGDIIPKTTESYEIEDLYRVLRDPESQDDLSFVGKWFYGCFREHLILPNFNTVENFMDAVLRYHRESRGYGYLLNIDFDLEIIKSILPDELELHILAELARMPHAEIDSPYFYWYFHTSDFFEQNVIWSSKDRACAVEILETFDHLGYMSRW